ncbi:MAG: TetR/AcrR family transcriptional regulator [Actinomycetia bacterium]|nr:TetR/AcrR family transcriptional regulator [Actinomycetes bacterium]
MAGTNPSPVRLPAAQRREQLLEVARHVLARQGFYETTMAEIADSAGVTKPVLYQHFASKRDLYTAVLQDIGARLRTSVLSAATAHAETPRQQVFAGFDAYVHFVENDPEGFQIFFSGTSRQDEEWADITRDVEHSIAAGVAQLIDVPEITPPHRQALACGILGLAEGMMRFWQTGGAADLDRDDLVNDLYTLAWSGLRGLEA